MLKRRISSSSSEKQEAKKSKSKSITNSRNAKTSKSGPKKTASTKSKHQRNSILNYMQPRISCSKVSETNYVSSRYSVDVDMTCKLKSNSSKQSKEFCPTCQTPSESFDDNLFQEHVQLCIEKVYDYKGPCPKGLACDEQNSDHFKMYNHDILAEKRSQANNTSSEVQTNECKIVLTDCENQRYEYAEESNDSCDDDDDNDIAEISETVVRDKAFNENSLELYSEQDGDGDNDGNDTAEISSTIINGKAFNENSLELYSEQCDDDDIKNDDINKTQQNISACHSIEDFCEACDDDELLANLNINTKIPSIHLIDNKCSQEISPANSSINPLKKEQSSSNISETVNSSDKQSSIQPSMSTSTKQADIGTYFGIKALQKTMLSTEQKTIKYKKTQDDMDSLNGDNVNGGYGGRKTCPYYKKIPGTPFVVDAFDFGPIPGIKAYFLSHFHIDHYKGLRARFSKTIYCSKITANLVRSRIKVDARFVKELPMNVATPVDKVQVTLLEANHCPGAVLFLFELPTGENYLHTGDFRASRSMEKYKELRVRNITSLFLDTTYCDPAYNFPSQDEMVQFAVKKAVQAKQKNPRTLIVCGTYTIGKEKVFLAIAEALGCKVSVTKEKKRILDCFECDRVSTLVTTDWKSGGVHVLKIGDLTVEKLQSHLKKYKQSYNELLAFKPTGWEQNARSARDIRTTISGPITIYGVPYSEHSSFKELEQFVKFIKPNRIIPTVNVSSKEQRAILDSWISH